ncbi:hypothetical protein MNBD_NITROSPIRAE03-670 [hydrothermal vent metagenome]|uniref:Uncharacterized protein n=1 Tax=hydrothermal vent metagenome TaxID=652676 RepID=A0A3B1CM12_9ZZZZ
MSQSTRFADFTNATYDEEEEVF